MLWWSCVHSPGPYISLHINLLVICNGSDTPLCLSSTGACQQICTSKCDLFVLPVWTYKPDPIIWFRTDSLEWPVSPLLLSRRNNSGPPERDSSGIIQNILKLFLKCLNKCQKGWRFFSWNGCKLKKKKKNLPFTKMTYYLFIVFHCFCLDGENEQCSHPFICAPFSTFSNAGFAPQRVVGVLYSPQFSGRALSPAAVSSCSMMWGHCSRWGRRDFWPRGPLCGWHLRAHTNATSVMCSMLWSWLVHTHTHAQWISVLGDE